VEDLGLDESHFNVVCDHLCAAITRLGCSPDDVLLVSARVVEWKDCILCQGEWA